MDRALCPVLIGRESQLTALEDALLAANRAEGQIVLLAGEAGLGKSRLATELQKRALRIGMTVLWGGCSEAELALPYLPFLEAIGNYLATSDLAVVREQLGPVRRELAHMFPQLEPGAGPREQGDPTQAKLRLFESIMTLLRIPATSNGALLVLEDLHWSDVSTRELLDYLARRMAGMRMLILGTYRSDELHRKHPLAPIIQGWRRARSASVIELPPLAVEGVGDMVAAIFDYDEVTKEFAEFLYARSEGNPFVLEELLKAALDRGDIYRTPERWERKDLTELRLPQTVRDTILLRVERLSPEQAEVLQTASVLGPAWNYRSLLALAGKDEPTVQAALQASLQQQLLEDDPGGSGRYRFRHALTRESIYEDMIAPRREQLHAQAAAMLAEVSGTTPMELTYHLFAANRWSEAIPVGLKAAEDAERSWAYADAARLYERMLGHVSDDLTRGQLLCRIGEAYHNALDPARAQRYLEQGIPLLERLGQRREASRYRLVLGRCHWERSRPEVARQAYEQARLELEADGPSQDLATAYIRLAGLHLFDSEYEECFALASRAVEIAEAAGADMSATWAGVFVAGALTRMNRAEEGFALIDRSYREALQRGHLWIARNALHNSMVYRCQNLGALDARSRLDLYTGLPASFFVPFDHGTVWWYLGYPRKALAFQEQALTLARESESSTGENWIRRFLAVILAELERADDALAILPAEELQKELQDRRQFKQFKIETLLATDRRDAAVAEAMSIFDRARWGSAAEQRWLFDAAVEALLLGGRQPEAERLAESTREGAADHDPHQNRMEGRLAFAHHDYGRARERLTRVLEAFSAADYGVEAMRTRRALAEVEAAAGNREAAELHLRHVIEMADKREAVRQGKLARQHLAELGFPVDERLPEERVTAGTITERLVTVLFLDIRGYTPMTVREAPERMAETVASLYRWARQEVERHHGMVDKYEGDAIMATFNVTGPRLDHCLQALQAALAIRDKASTAGLPVGAGIAVGPAVVGKLTDSSQISTFGEVTNLASRLQAKAEPGEILLSDEAYRRTHDWLKEKSLAAKEESLQLKGFPRPVTAFRLPGLPEKVGSA